MTIRTEVVAVLESFLAGWATGDRESLGVAFHPTASLRSSAHGDLTERNSIADLLGADFGIATPFRLTMTNVYVAGSEKHVMVTAYVFGQSANELSVARGVFGGTLVGELTPDEHGWKFDDLKLSIPWIDGETSKFAKWRIPSSQGWKLGDPTPTIVSELDSPWARGMSTLPSVDAVQQVADAYTRYAWAIDQGDIHLLQDCYTHDAFGEFPPMGHRDGRHEIIGQQKEFRRQWPWMQHFGRPLSIEVAEDETTAHMVIGRVMPQRPQTPEGRDIYGAHYKLDLRRERGVWRISYFDYRLGWIMTDSEN
ncbi:nuclear transport factor 2 family protein [Paenarthrobacter sp. NPDC092416]|uniref:nuclear transport factor 2 family protein n=1 Tax=Paenarthrobacter sp. NPDC092416 TaxID=3364386 RepID=UPI0037FDEA36